MNPPEVTAVADQLLASLQSKGGSRRMLSSTFWHQFRFTRRSPERIADVTQALAGRGVVVLRPTPDIFGKEARSVWIELALRDTASEVTVVPTVAAALSPRRVRRPTNWISELLEQEFESEREVDSFFVLPLLERLGYSRDDIAQGWKFEFQVGSSRKRGVCDFCLFDGPGRDPHGALLVVETKATGKGLTPEAEDQARSYAIWLCAPFFLVTNADEIRVFANVGVPKPPMLVMTIRRENLRSRWPDLLAQLGRAAVVARKAEFTEILRQARATMPSTPA
jgi:hypothetical protein